MFVIGERLYAHPVYLWSYLVQVFMFHKKMWEIKSKHILYSKLFFFRKSYLLWDNVKKKYGTAGRGGQMIIWRMRIAFRIPKATDTHSECVILIAFPRNQWLHERAPMLRYTYIAVLFTVIFSGSLLCRIQVAGLKSMPFSRVNVCCKCSNEF